MSTRAMPTRLKSTEHAIEYLGSSFTVDNAHGYVLISFKSYRSEAKGEEAFDFMLELYSEQPIRRLIYDTRPALWPSDNAALKRRFRRHGQRMPRSVIAVVCNDVNDPQMLIGKEAYEHAGHDVFLTTSEAEAIEFALNTPAKNDEVGTSADGQEAQGGIPSKLLPIFKRVFG